MSTAMLVYDVETYPNVFTCACRFYGTTDRRVFEISSRRNDIKLFIQFLDYLRTNKIPMVGFNNLSFDYPVIHYIIKHQDTITPALIFDKADYIIKTSWDDRFSNIIWEKDQYVPQIDLYKVHHFDNPAKATSLKIIEFNLRMKTIEDLPYPPGSWLSYDEIDNLIPYNFHDVDATHDFLKKSMPQIEFRKILSEKYDQNMMNYNDTKIGKNYFINELEKNSPGCCYDTSSGSRKVKQTKRKIIRFSDILFPYIKFTNPEMQRVHNWFLNKSITSSGTKGDFKVSATIRGFEFVFGTGGIHGSIDPCVVSADGDYIIKDIDVKSYYPNLGIRNRLYPEHLSENFCDIYEKLYNERQTHKKGTPENAMLKLALNGTYGDSNSEYSPLYDPQYTMAITINGQLLLCMIAEVLMSYPDITMIQINTDGLTIKMPKQIEGWVQNVIQWWEKLTRLELEEVNYSRFFVRDVNNYIAEYPDGKVKRKGAYEYELDWNQNQSALVVQKAAEALLLHDKNPAQFIAEHTDIFDFMLRTKVPRSSKLISVDYDGNEYQEQNVTRYYVSYFGRDLLKVMPPTVNQLKKNPQAGLRYIGIQAGYKCTVCNDIDHAVIDDINHEWYLKEVRKLTDPILKGRRR